MYRSYAIVDENDPREGAVKLAALPASAERTVLTLRKSGTEVAQSATRIE